VARNHLLATPPPGAPVEARGDCFDVFARELDYVCCALRRLRVPSSDVEDLAHEVFLVLHRRWSDYDPSFPIRPWLFGIAFRVAAAHRRREGRQVSRPLLEVEDLSPSAEHAIQARQARAIILAALEQVPLPRRAVLVMHDLDGVTMRDIAAALSIPLFTTYSRLRKARKELEAAVRSLQNGENTR
jgi:RNA polymerase sigma-70 factor (ECF subfamily)